MKSYFWKFVICLLPCAIAALITGIAIYNFQTGSTGGLMIKLGTDLSGGTNLVYEIDLSRTRDVKEGGFDPARDTNILAEALKRRIDPNDLYNIIIRPAGGEGRVEIILPTGGTKSAAKAQEQWDALIAQLQKTRFDGEKKLEDVPRGKVFELADRIQLLQSSSKWENLLFRDPQGAKDKLGDEAWKRLKDRAVDFWAPLEAHKKEMAQLDNQPQRLKALSEFIFTKLSTNPEEATTEKVIDTWIKRQAWSELLVRIENNWKTLGLNNYKAEMDQIEPDSFDQLIGFVQSKGVLEVQAGLAIIEPLVGNNIPFADDTPSRKEIEDFVKEYYGESAASILKEIEKQSQQEGRSRDLTMEEVQRIKDLVAKVGSLEFRILANSEDDKEGIKAAMTLINSRAENPAVKERLDKAQNVGLPPPAPEDLYTINPNNQKSYVKYEWIELGRQERRTLHLDNASKNDPDPRVSFAWKEASFKNEKAFHLPEGQGSTKSVLQGALFYRRECKNRNLPEEERRNKEIEYFVLTRTPEFDPADPSKQTPKIDGSYLTNAQSSVGESLTPTCNFAFNTEGGRLFGNITRKNIPSGSGGEESQIKRFLAIILDDQVTSAPSINSVITTSGQISGNFTRKEVDNLVNILRSGRLPATLKQQPVSETTMGATLGEDTIQAGVVAVVLSFLAVLIFMCVYYRLPGVVASIALLANLLLTVGFMIGVQATFTLPGLAGLVLMLGMAVDANVLIYERLREERDRGVALAQALRNAYSRALPTIIDTHLSSIFTAVVLYVVGNDQLKGFGVSLTAGLVISLFTSLYMTHVIFDWLLAKKIFTDFHPMKLFARPNFDFMSIRHVMFVGTLVIAILGMVLFIYRLPDDLNIDFTGGTAYSGQLNDPVRIEGLRKFFTDSHQHDLLKFDADGVREEADSEGRSFYVKYKGEDKGRVIALANKVEGETAPARVETVKKRLSQLPDASFELSFPNAQKDEKKEANATRYFTVRTSEKETEIVQTVLDRLLRDDKGGALLKKVYVKADPLTSRETKLRFSFDREGEKTESAGAAPSFVKSLFTRELFKQFGVDPKEKDKMPLLFEVIPEGSLPDGRYKVLRVRFETELTADQKKKVEGAVTELVTAFESRPQPDRLENFDSQLANETRYRAMWAILLSWVAIAVYLWFRFGNWTFGLAAVICLVHDLFLTLGAIAACHYLHGTFIGDMLALDDFKIDLPAVAALLTLVGYSVNDTIVVFDRIREVRGKNPDLSEKMINDSVNQTLSRTVLASLTTWLVVFVLYVWGGPGVHLFAFVMVVGVIIGTYSSIYIASPLLLMLGEGAKESTPGRTPAKTPQIQGSPA